MKKSFFKYVVGGCLTLCMVYSCNDQEISEPDDPALGAVQGVSDLKVERNGQEEEVILSWKNPDDPYLANIELSYFERSAKDERTVLLLDAGSGEQMTYTLDMETPEIYNFGLTALNMAGIRSEEMIAGLHTAGENVWISRADTLMQAIVSLYLDGKPRDIWSSQYPQGGGYWDGAAVIWGHGAAFSGYTAFKHATWNVPELKAEVEENYDERLLTAIDKFRNRRNGGPEAYAVYPGEGDERYYDDNIWIGIDMVSLYILTNDARYLERAEIVWNFVQAGTDDIMGGGVYWKEGQKSKHTCSTAPAAVLAAKLYEATGEEHYLTSAKAYYSWVKELLQDPADYLYWDNARLSDENDPDSGIEISTAKYSYNSGQPMQAAVLLYKITNEPHYLTDAQHIAEAAHQRWFTPFQSHILDESFNILEPGHVWFQGIMLRGYAELYLVDHNDTYIEDYRKTLQHAWLSDARNPDTNLINENFKGTTTQDSWEILHQGAIVEMLSQLALLDAD
ncbi:glycoside hydrolase family 76 protein [Sinomicrobium oceani]|uniref:glycoside hydrolase family 76 protein n=1 Tax=Sinomicrobium oceani TaxID=1150368 RepID=UPI00227A099F|nr:glycoside hydrolase family 76 protein [Sinomicrobium oceani]